MNYAEPAASILRSAAPSIQAAARSGARFVIRLARPCLAGLLLLPLSIPAADYGSIHLRSNHSTPGRHFERNLGAGIELDLHGYWRFATGGFVNSHRDPAAYAGPLYGTDHVMVGALFVSGYENTTDAGEVFPLPVVKIRPLDTRITPSFTIAPLNDGNGYVVLTSLDWRF